MYNCQNKISQMQTQQYDVTFILTDLSKKQVWSSYSKSPTSFRFQIDIKLRFEVFQTSIDCEEGLV